MPNRVEQIIKLVGNHRFGQIFITDTHQSRLQDILFSHNIDFKLFRISDNRVEESSRNESIQDMRRSKTISLAEAVRDYIKEMNLGDKLSEVGVINSWEETVGKAISSRTTKIYIRDHVLYVHLNSSVVRNELLMLREVLREKLNQKAGSEVIKEIILR